MNRDPRSQRLKEIFVAAITATAEDRDRVISQATTDDPSLLADVLALLDHHENPSALLREPPKASLDAQPPAVELPLVIDRYLLRELLGEGATGRVFAAVQTSPHRPVAVKLLRPGLQLQDRTAERFLREADLLAKLDHPGIARVYESGVASLPWGPQAYIAMELIEGLPLTEFATRHALTIPKKLELLAKVCDAVEYSHSLGVVHRDLKPSNVLVQTDGQPRVLDFGVAHAMHDEAGTQPTLGGDLVGTLAYMSPEYAQGNDQGGTRSDIYSLGVMAYELLSGVRPLVTEGTNLWVALRAIREHRFPSLRERSPLCGVDLDLVVSKALQLDPRDRYQSAAAFAADLRRIIENRPVSARPPTIGYVLGKFLRRTRRASIATTIVIAFLLASGAAATRQLLRDREKLESLRWTLDLTKELPQHRPGVTSPDITAEKLSRISEKARSELRSHPNAEAKLQFQIGEQFIKLLGRHAEAERAFLRAKALSQQDAAETVLAGDVTLAWANLSSFRDNPHLSEQSLRQLVLELAARGNDPERLYRARLTLAWALAARGLSDELTTQIRELDTLADSLQGTYRGSKALGHPLLRAYALYNSGRSAEAERLLPSIPEIKEALAATPWRHMCRNAASIQAFVQLALGRTETAQDLLEHLLMASVAELGPKSDDVLNTRQRLAGLLWVNGNIEAAEREFAELVAISGPEGVNDPVLRGNSLNSHGVCLRDLGRFEEADSALRQALSIRLTTGGPDSLVVADTHMNLASLYLRWRNGHAALRSAEEAARVRRLRGDWTPAKECESLAMLGGARSMVGGPAAGLDELKKAWSVRLENGLVTNWRTDVAAERLIECLVALRRPDEARRVAEQDHARLIDLAGASNIATQRAAKRLQRLARDSMDAETVGTGLTSNDPAE